MPSFISGDHDISDLMRFPYRYGAVGEKLVESTRCLLDYGYAEVLDDISQDVGLTVDERRDVVVAFNRCTVARAIAGVVPRGRYFIKAVSLPPELLITHEVIYRESPKKKFLWKVASLDAAQWVVIFRLGHVIDFEP